MEAATGSFFTTGDVVLQNPKETAVIFFLVVVIALLLQSLHVWLQTTTRARYIRALYVPIAAQLLVVGSIGLIFVPLC